MGITPSEEPRKNKYLSFYLISGKCDPLLTMGFSSRFSTGGFVIFSLRRAYRHFFTGIASATPVRAV